MKNESNVYINNAGYMNKLATMPILVYGKNPSKSSSPELNETWHESSMHQVNVPQCVYKSLLYDDLEWVKLLKCHLEEKITCRNLANGQDIDHSEKQKWPKASSAPLLGLFSIIFKHVYLRNNFTLR